MEDEKEEIKPAPLGESLIGMFLSPTSEPPDEQEELWKEVSQWFGIETYSVSSTRELQKRFTIHRKRD